jgi:4-hydroxybenzoate polyprenyltransferase
MKYLKLIRYQNLILLALMQLIVRFGYLEQIKIPLSLFYWQYALLVLSTVLIAAGGYVINDIFDQEIDFENKPNQSIVGKSISENTAYIIYASLTITGVALGFILANSVEHPNFAVVFVLIATLLYFYASSLKKIAVVGNIVVALLLAFSVIIIGLFDIFPNTFDTNRAQMAIAFTILLDYAKFAFVINLIREIVKDMEDIVGDKNNDIRTLPVVIGIPKTSKITFGLLLIPIIYLLYYCNTYLMQNDLIYATIYIFLFVVAPLLYSAIKVFNASEKSQFHHISSVLKWVIFFGILSIAIINYNINHHV